MAKKKAPPSPGKKAPKKSLIPNVTKEQPPGGEEVYVLKFSETQDPDPTDPTILGSVSAIDVLNAERNRFNAMAMASKGKGKDLLLGMAWAFNLASAHLGSLNAPEKLRRFLEVASAEEEAKMGLVIAPCLIDLGDHQSPGWDLLKELQDLAAKDFDGCIATAIGHTLMEDFKRRTSSVPPTPPAPPPVNKASSRPGGPARKVNAARAAAKKTAAKKPKKK